MNYEVRKYQEEHIESIIKHLGKHKNVLAQLATGGGKTVEFSKLAHRFYQSTGKATLILVFREELLEQSRETMKTIFGEEMSIIKAGTTWVKFAPAYIGMVESVYKRLNYMPEVGLVIVDEAHNASFNKVIQYYTKEYVIGFTATPKSSSKKEPLNKYYGAIAVGPSIKTLIEYKALCQNVTRSPKEVVDRTRLQMASNGEFDIGFMADEFRKQKYIMSTVLAYKKYCKGKKAIVYNVNIEHSKEVAEAFEFCGHDSRHVDGTTSDLERKEIFKWFRETPAAILCNVGVATMGFDEPTIEVVMVNRATASMPLWLQMCGRGSRPITQDFITKKQDLYPYPLTIKNKFQIIDMGGNCITHGDWSDDRNWSYIFHNPDVYYGDGMAPMKECPECGCYVHAAAIKCTGTLQDGEDCTYIFDRKKHEEQKFQLEFITITQDENIKKLIKTGGQENHAPFFEMAVQMIDGLDTVEVEMNEDKKSFLFDQYFSFVEEWYPFAFPGKYFNREWYKSLAKYHFNKYFKYKEDERAKSSKQLEEVIELS